MSWISNRQKKTLTYVTLIVYIVVIGLLVRDRYIQYFATETDQPTVIIKTTEEPKLPEPTSSETPTNPLPEMFQLDVPFLVQAPFAVWDELHGEACEEASLMMVKYFRDKAVFGSLEAADQEIRKLVAWETENNYKIDVTVSELSKIAADFYGMKTGRIITNPTVTEIKREIAAGRPVIVPAAGRVLPNPYFTPPGPLYHMFVIKGYTPTDFITNDPGTKRGNGMAYRYDDLLNAMHDWNTSDILKGQKVVLVFD